MNYQAVTTLLDTSKWKKFAKEDYVDDVETSVIGSPTIEMWMASWNEKYEDTLAFDSDNAGYGFKVGKTEDSLGSGIAYLDMQMKDGWRNTLYYPHTGGAWNNCEGYWLASPSSASGHFIITIKNNGAISSNYYYNNGYVKYGVRPVVCLKTGISAEKDENGVWQLDK